MAATVELIFEGVDNATNTLKDIQSTIKDMGGGLSQQMGELGNIMTAGVTTPIVAGFGLAARQSIQFETAMADVSKVSGLTGQDLADLGDEIVGMTRTIPKSQTDLAKLAGSAARLGIARESMGDFVQLASEMSVAFDIEAEKVGDSAAKIANSFNMVDDAGQLDMSRLRTYGDVVNTLADSMATTEANIINATQRMAGVGALFGFSENDIAGVAAGFTALGEAPEVAARAFNTTAQRLSQATSLSSDAQQAFEDLGLSAEGMEKRFIEGDGQAALMDFLEAVKAGGPEAGRAVSEIVGTGFSDNILKAAGGLSTFERAMESVANAETGGGADVATSFEQMAQTTESQMALARNALAEMALEIGSVLLPALNELLAAATPAVLELTEFAKANPGITKTAVAIAGVAAALGPLLIITAKLITSIKVITALLTVVKVASIGAAVGFGTFAAAALPLIGTMALVVAAGLALGFAFRWIWDTLAAIDWAAVGVKIRAMVDGAIAAVTNLGLRAASAFQGLLNTAAGVWADISAAASSAWAGVSTSISNAMLNGASAVIGFVSEVLAGFAGIPGQVSGYMSMVSASLDISAIARSAGAGLASAFGAGITSRIGAAVSAAQNMASQVRALLPGSDAKMGPLSTLSATGPGLIDTFSEGLRRSSPNAFSETEDLAGGVRDRLSPELSQAARRGTSQGTGAGTGGGAAVTINYSPNFTGQESDGDLAGLLRDHSREIAKMVKRELDRMDSMRLA